MGSQLRSEADYEATLFVGGLKRDTSEPEILDTFSRYGKVRKIWIARHPPGFAFVYFEEYRDAMDAAHCLDGKAGCRTILRVERYNYHKLALAKRLGGGRGSPLDEDRRQREYRGNIGGGRVLDYPSPPPPPPPIIVNDHRRKTAEWPYNKRGGRGYQLESYNTSTSIRHYHQRNPKGSLSPIRHHKRRRSPSPNRHLPPLPRAAPLAPINMWNTPRSPSPPFTVRHRFHRQPSPQPPSRYQQHIPPPPLSHNHFQPTYHRQMSSYVPASRSPPVAYRNRISRSPLRINRLSRSPVHPGAMNFGSSRSRRILSPAPAPLRRRRQVNNSPPPISPYRPSSSSFSRRQPPHPSSFVPNHVSYRSPLVLFLFPF